MVAVEKLMTKGLAQLDIERLKPHPNEYRLRVGKCRILFKSDDDLLFIFKAGFRGDVYK
jgi:mRNA interferase RelE/StbE